MATVTFDFIDTLQARTAMLAVGRSTLRNQGAPGMVDVARKYLRAIDLTKFQVTDEPIFRTTLETHTQALMKRFPAKAQKNWGAARKVMNIFLRDVLYNHHLCKAYKLSKIESWLELPLDTDVYNGLCDDWPEGLKVPKWPRIKRLTPEVSDELQSGAQRIAKSLSTKRIHLDVRYWRKSAIDILSVN